MRIEHQSLIGRGEPLAADYSAMVAAVLASQISGPTASAQLHHDVARRVADSREEALATLMRVQPGWRAAVGALGGSFHPGVAGRIGAKGL